MSEDTARPGQVPGFSFLTGGYTDTLHGQGRIPF